MGTSKSYEMPSGTNWNTTKTEFSRSAGKVSNNEKISGDKIGSLISRFVNSAGGSRSYSSNGTGFGNSKAAVSAGRSLGGFLKEVSEEGAEPTFREHFGNSLDGKSADDICLELTEYFCDQASQINNSDAKSAMYDLLEEILDKAEDLEEVEEVFNSKANNEDLNNLFERYFGFYVFEQIKRSFYSRLEKKYGENAAEELIETRIKDYVLARVEEEGNNRELINQDFNNTESVKIVDEILQETIAIFE